MSRSSEGVAVLTLTLLCVSSAFRPMKMATVLRPVAISTVVPMRHLANICASTQADLDVSLTEPPAPKRVPIGSAPEFAIAGDSTVETPQQRAVVATHFAITAFNLWTAMTALAPSLHAPLDILPVIITIIASIILGDLGTGIFHWSVDNYGGIKTPVFGSVCVAFQGHHDTPWTITFRSFCNNVYKIAYGTIPPLLLLALLQPGPLVLTFFTLFINWWLISQELHKFAHMRTPPPLVRSLQDAGLILSRKEHGLHHTSPFEAHYCILTGVCNPLLDRTGFFRRLERVVYRLTGNESNTWKADGTLRGN